MRHRRIRRPHRAVQLPVIQPVLGAHLARVNDDIPRPAIRMGIHGRAAFRATDPPLQIPPIGLPPRRNRDLPPRPQIVDNSREDPHRDQHPSTTLAIKNPFPRHRRMRQSIRAYGTENARGNTQNPHAVGVRIREMRCRAVIADQIIRFILQPHRGAAVRAIHISTIGRNLLYRY